MESGDGLNVIGVTVPGIPMVIIGRNERIAWGVTSLEFDVEDCYLERIDMRTGMYLSKGRPVQARQEREEIKVKNGRGETFVNWVTGHGPVLTVGRNANVAIRWTGADAGITAFPLNQLDRARNWSEFRAALANFPGPPQNFVYADVDGNIGYQVAGRLPIRRGFSGDVPLDGASGNQEWDGYVPFEELPSAYNPASGMIVTANQNPFPSGYPYTVSGYFHPSYRARQIQDLLGRQPGGWKAGGMLTIQKDVYSAFHYFLAQQIVAACERRAVKTSPVSDAAAVLKEWNGQMELDSAGAMITDLVYDALRRALADVASKAGALYSPPIAYQVVENLLRQRPAGWVDDWDRLLVESLTDAIEHGRRMAGPDVRRWNYGEYHRVALFHPVFGSLPVVGRRSWLIFRNPFNVGVVPMSGAVTTVKQTTARLGPSMRMVVDLGAPQQSLLNLTIGESGMFTSSHYSDQWPSYYVGTSFPLEFPKTKAEDTLTLEPR